METMQSSGQDCWLSRVDKIRQILNIPPFQQHETPSAIGKKCCYQLQGKFESFYLSEINKAKTGSDGLNHNKLMFYTSIKGSFKPGWYIENILNRNQRSEIR